MSKYSPWFPPETLPVRIGVYEISREFNACKRNNPPYYRLFDGIQWNVGSRDIAIAAVARTIWVAPAPWRGLSRRPK